MPLSIRLKLFLAMFATICLVVGCLYLINQWSFQRGFKNFVDATEKASIEQLGIDLEDIYMEEGNWDLLRQQPERWSKLIRGSRRAQVMDRQLEGRLENPLKEGQSSRASGRPHAKTGRFEGRVILLDAEKKVIYGYPSKLENLDIQPLKQDDNIIGYLGLAPQKRLANRLHLQFVKQQKITFVLIAFGMALLAALMSLPITSRMVQPIKKLAASTRELASGNLKERTLVSSQDEIGQLARDFNMLANTLENNEKSRRQWVADISHELRTPLAVLRCEIEAMQDEVLEFTPQTLGALHDQVLQLNRLINDLYELSMSDLGALNYKKEFVTPVQILEKTISLFMPQLKDRNLRVTTVLSSGRAIEMLADRERLQQLFSNLIKNSLRYTDSGGNLEIYTECNNQRLTFHFLDSAPGVPTDELPKLFDRLYRVEASRSREVGGAGLGLSICRNIVEAHDGTIEAKNSPYGGLWLTISFSLNG